MSGSRDDANRNYLDKTDTNVPGDHLQTSGQLVDTVTTRDHDDATVPRQSDVPGHAILQDSMQSSFSSITDGSEHNYTHCPPIRSRGSRRLDISVPRSLPAVDLNYPIHDNMEPFTNTEDVDGVKPKSGQLAMVVDGDARSHSTEHNSDRNTAALAQSTTGSVADVRANVGTSYSSIQQSIQQVDVPVAALVLVTRNESFPSQNLPRVRCYPGLTDIRLQELLEYQASKGSYVPNEAVNEQEKPDQVLRANATRVQKGASGNLSNPSRNSKSTSSKSVGSPLNKLKGPQGKPQPPERLFQCHMWKHNPAYYARIKCPCKDTPFQGFKRVKEHLKRFHSIKLRCCHCEQPWPSDDNIDDQYSRHVDRCPKVIKTGGREHLPEALDYRQSLALDKNYNNTEGGMAWTMLYYALFPDQGVPFPEFEYRTDFSSQGTMFRAEHRGTLTLGSHNAGNVRSEYDAYHISVQHTNPSAPLTSGDTFPFRQHQHDVEQAYSRTSPASLVTFERDSNWRMDAPGGVHPGHRGYSSGSHSTSPTNFSRSVSSSSRDISMSSRPLGPPNDGQTDAGFVVHEDHPKEPGDRKVPAGVEGSVIDPQVLQQATSELSKAPRIPPEPGGTPEEHSNTLSAFQSYQGREETTTNTLFAMTLQPNQWQPVDKSQDFHRFLQDLFPTLEYGQVEISEPELLGEQTLLEFMNQREDAAGSS